MSNQIVGLVWLVLPMREVESVERHNQPAPSPLQNALLITNKKKVRIARGRDCSCKREDYCRVCACKREGLLLQEPARGRDCCCKREGLLLLEGGIAVARGRGCSC